MPRRGTWWRQRELEIEAQIRAENRGMPIYDGRIRRSDLDPENLYDQLTYESLGRRGPGRQDVYRAPGGRMVSGSLSPYTNTRYLGNPDVQARAYGITDPALVQEIEDLIGAEVSSLLPDVSSREEFWQDVEFFEGLSAQYMDVDRLDGRTSEFDANLGGTQVLSGGEGTEPAAMNITGRNKDTGELVSPDYMREIPTQTTNPLRPRTVAAAWDLRRNVLTVVFRDGTFYNYYEVSLNEWRAFKSANSKGRFILDVLNAKPRGTADASEMEPDVREFIYRAARTAQVRNYSGSYTAPNTRSYWNPRKQNPLVGSQESWRRAEAKRRKENPGTPGKTWFEYKMEQDRKMQKSGLAKAAAQARKNGNKKPRRK